MSIYVLPYIIWVVKNYRRRTLMNQREQNGSQYYKRIIVALVLGWVAIWIYRTILTPIYPQIQSSLGDVSNAEIGLIASVYFFAYTGM